MATTGIAMLGVALVLSWAPSGQIPAVVKEYSPQKEPSRRTASGSGSLNIPSSTDEVMDDELALDDILFDEILLNGSQLGTSEPLFDLDQHHIPSDTLFSEVDRFLNQMAFGNIVFNAPTQMNIADSSKLQLLLSLNDSVEELKKNLTELGTTYSSQIGVSNRMEAILTGEQFEISNITPEVQAISSTRTTEWNWNITPLEPGFQKLYLTMNAVIEVNGQSTPRMIRTFDQTIEVFVTPSQKINRFISEHWEWLWATLILPLIGWLWHYKKNSQS